MLRMKVPFLDLAKIEGVASELLRNYFRSKGTSIQLPINVDFAPSRCRQAQQST